MTPVAHRTIGILLGLVGIIALVLSLTSVLDGVWLPAAVLLPGIAAYGWSMLKR